MSLLQPARSLPRSLGVRTLRHRVAFAFDIDGVLKAGPTVLEPARRALQLLEGNNARSVRVPYVYVTNGGGPSETERAALLQRELGVPVSPTQVIQAHTVMQSLVQDFGDKPVLMIGGPEGVPGASRAVMEGYGFRDVYTAQDIQAWAPPVYPFAKLDPRWHEAGAVRQADFSQVHFAAIMVFHDSRDWGRDIQLMCDVLRSRDGVVGNVGDDTHPQVPLFFSHGDLLWGNDFLASRFGQGAFQHAVAAVYKATSGRDLVATTFGKPERGTYEYAHERLRARAAELGHEAGELNTWMVGDNPASDIAGANGYGWASALVRTGVFRDVEGPPAHQPTIIVDDVEGAVLHALEQEWGTSAQRKH
ncbi:HAD-superfamily hydrolase [Tilletiopsis washingtonensis]|uniref:HAD-superfamily hydrolase n=1 Tax=Tilletiopsis washingtonensis TaxID=58919 RepID=A0A316ZBI5_9BASI|nr:HAD-superfamily hydrolase [Tilletiopsis washingtonensis]PWN99207.1 HAD-superfamily hydrolase [Tilletiopsis washingtonensis]